MYAVKWTLKNAAHTPKSVDARWGAFISTHNICFHREKRYSLIWSYRHRDIEKASVPLSGHLNLNHWSEFNQTCYMISPSGKRVWKQHYFYVCPSVLSSISQAISSKTTDRTLTKLATFCTCTWLPHVARLCKSNIISSICPSIHDAISNISTKRGEFVTACHRLCNLVDFFLMTIDIQRAC